MHRAAGLGEDKPVIVDATLGTSPLASDRVGPGKEEGRAPPRRRAFDPDFSTGPFDGLLDNRQPDTAGLAFVTALQCLKYCENSFVKFGGNAWPVVVNTELGHAASHSRGNRDSAFSAIMVTDGVADQVPQHMFERRPLRADDDCFAA